MIRKFAFVAVSSILLTLLTEPVSHSNESASPASVGLAKDIIYFVMPDRYRNGDTSNDLAGGISSDPTGGFNPASTAFFHGGDLKGLTGNCERGDNGLYRIKDLGFTAIWITPLVVQQMAKSDGAGYHGYWGVDFLNVDPHLGSNADLAALATCAKKLGLKLILDVVTNHTGDVIQYNNQQAFIPAGQENVKNPSWLNDLSNYHNVGDMAHCWGNGPCTQLGDFYGLDDLATEKESVYKGWIDVYGSWISKYGFSGFRVDTARHVDDNFFKNWSPGINKIAAQSGIKNFTIFGEVWDVNPVNLVSFVRDKGLQTVLDFPFQSNAVQFASGYSGAEVLANLFDYDDLYTTPNSSASNLVTFLGNHDMGRVGYLIEASQLQAGNDLLARTELAHSLMYLSRGIPTVYYGDEVGMTGSGTGNDQMARQDMFATKVEVWKTEKRIGGTPVGSGDSFSGPENPISTYLRSLAEIRSKYPALANGAMQIRYAKNNLFIFSKYDLNENREFVVALNSARKDQSANITTASQGKWTSIFGKGSSSSQGLNLNLNLPALSTSIFISDRKISPVDNKITHLTLRRDFLTGYLEVLATTQIKSLQPVSFEVRKSADSHWSNAGVDFNWPYRVYIDTRNIKAGSTIEIRALVTDKRGKTRGQSTTYSVS